MFLQFAEKKKENKKGNYIKRCINNSQCLPRCGLYLAEFIALADTSLSDSEPRVSYSVIGM